VSKGEGKFIPYAKAPWCEDICRGYGYRDTCVVWPRSSRHDFIVRLEV